MFKRTSRIIGSAVLAVAGFVCFSHAARASTLTETFNLPTTTSSVAGAFATSTSFPEFNSALGTLNSISVSIAGLVGGTNASVTNLSTLFDPSPFGTFVPTASNTSLISSGGPFTLSFTDTNSLDLATFIGTGTASVLVSVSDEFGPTVAVTFTPGSTLIYNYTPVVVAATPEPASLALLLTGLAGLPALRRRIRGA